jgi:hypothetical protein
MRRIMLKRGVLVAALTSFMVGAVGHADAGSPRASTCQTGQLRITISPVPGGANHLGAVVRFLDEGGECALRGYPGLDGVTAGGHVVVQARRTLIGYLGGAKAINNVILRHGASASALYEGLDEPLPGRSCPNYRFVTITPPNDTRSVRLRQGRGLCSPQIHPVISGRTGGSNVPKQ